MKRKICLVAFGILCGCAMVSLATDLTITITAATKKVTLSGQVSVRETVDVTITNIGSSSAENLLLGIIDGTNLVAAGSSFTNLSGAAVGELNLNTEELTNVFAKATVGRSKRTFDLVVWDTDAYALLANDTIDILNNPYVSGMTLPSSITNEWTEADARYLKLTAQYVKTVEVSGGLLSISGTYTQTVALTTNTFTNTVQATDGAGSGYDADLLDGQDGAYYASTTTVAALEARTSVWNQAATDATSWTNWWMTNTWGAQILAIEGQTDGWNSAWTWVQANSNGYDYVEANSNYWDWAWDWVTANSNDFDYVQAHISEWDIAYLWVNTNSNGFDYVEAHSNEWDDAWSWVTGNSNAFDYVQSRTSTWDTAVQTVTAGTNIDIVTNGTARTISAGSGLATDAELAGATGTNIVIVGTITQGVWNGTAIADGYLVKTGDWTGTFDGQEGIWYVNIGNQTGTMTDAVMDTIVRVGTVTSGTWTATAIGDAYITKTGAWTGTFDGQEGAWYRSFANVTNVTYVCNLTIQDPTNNLAYYLPNPWGADVTLVEAFVQCVGMTGNVDVIRRPRTTAWYTYTTINSNIVADADGTADTTFDSASWSNEWRVGIIATDLSAFATTNLISVDFKVTKP